MPYCLTLSLSFSPFLSVCLYAQTSSKDFTLKGKYNWQRGWEKRVESSLFMLLLLIETIFSLHSCRRRAQLQDKAINLLNGWHKANNFQSTFTNTYAHTRTKLLCCDCIVSTGQNRGAIWRHDNESRRRRWGWRVKQSRVVNLCALPNMHTAQPPLHPPPHSAALSLSSIFVFGISTVKRNAHASNASYTQSAKVYAKLILIALSKQFLV